MLTRSSLFRATCERMTLWPSLTFSKMSLLFCKRHDYLAFMFEHVQERLQGFFVALHEILIFARYQVLWTVGPQNIVQFCPGYKTLSKSPNLVIRMWAGLFESWLKQPREEDLIDDSDDDVSDEEEDDAEDEEEEDEGSDSASSSED